MNKRHLENCTHKMANGTMRSCYRRPYLAKHSTARFSGRRSIKVDNMYGCRALKESIFSESMTAYK